MLCAVLCNGCVVLCGVVLASPWVCNCGHPWSSHRQRVVETAQPTGLIAEVGRVLHCTALHCSALLYTALLCASREVHD